MRTVYVLFLLGWLSCAATGCGGLPQRPHFALPEDEPLTTERLEALLTPGMPIEEARRIMELYGFRCTYANAIGIEYMHCEQQKQKHLWPFRGVWSATVYHNGFVQRVQGRYELAIVDHGTCIPRKYSRVIRPAPPAGLQPGGPMPAFAAPGDVETLTAPPICPEGEVAPADGPEIEAAPPAGSAPVVVPTARKIKRSKVVR